MDVNRWFGYLAGSVLNARPNPVDEERVQATLGDYYNRVQMIRRRWLAYYGVYNPPLVVEDGEQDPNVIFNLARVIVDKGVAALFGKNVNFDLVGTRYYQGSRLGMRTDVELWLDDCWRANRKGALLQKLALNGAIAGHGFLKLLGPAPEHGHPFPRVINLNPLQVRVLFQNDDLDFVEQYLIEWNFIGPDNKMNYYRQAIRRESLAGKPEWVIETAMGTSMMADYKPTGPSVVWPYPWPPLVDCQNLPLPNTYYGMSDLEPDVLHLVDRVNFTLSNWSKTLRMHAHPQQYATGVDASQILTSPDNTLVLPDKEARLGLVEMLSEMQSTNTFYDKLLEALHELARIPEVASGKLENIGNLSGIALQILYEPLAELTGQKRENYGPLLATVNSRLLEMGGKDASKGIQTQWPELLPGDPETQRKVVSMDVALGITSKESAAGTFNHDWELEKARIDHEAIEAAELAAHVEAIKVGKRSG